MPDYETVLADARRLPPAGRIQLIEALWDTLPADCFPPMTEEWIAEIQRRSEEYDSGLAETVPWEQIRTDALRRAGLTVSDDADATR